MEWQLRDGSPSIGTALLVTVGDADAADVAVRAGADVLDVGPATPAAIEEIRGRHPDVGLAVPWRSPGATGHPAALPPATRLVCDDVSAAEAALEAGAPREAIWVAAPPDRVRAVAAVGWAVVADVDRAAPGPGQPPAGGQITPAQQIGNPAQDVTLSDENLMQRSRAGQGAPPGEAGGGGPAEEAAPGADAGAVSAVVAAAAISAWLGVAAVRTRHVPQVRRALDMTASIQGIRPPAWAVRALA